MNRRTFLQSAAAASLGGTLSRPKRLLAEDSAPTSWRTFEITTRADIQKYSGATRVWLPAALISRTPFQKTLSNTFQVDGGTGTLVEARPDGLGIIVAEFPADVKPTVTLTSRVATRDYVVDLSKPGSAPKADPLELEYFRRPTKMLPTDGIVAATATEITRDAATDLQKARAIYEWIVDNTFRDPKTRGCGTGNIRFMLESKNLGGKCADLNSLYVGLARAAGLPARDVFGVRIAKSKLGYKSLGASSENITKAQHCRAEVYLESYGWVPVDPADVRKVVLEEPPGNRPPDDPAVKAARKRLFGSWEMNWMAYNFAHDVALPRSAGPPLNFLMYPQAESGDGRVDSLDADSFKYEVTAREISSASE